MRAYIVGGAVRDELLGLPVKDRDWVVVGARPEDMLALGFRPVGKDFPVFLHPETAEEYALARTERKTGRGYKGFAFHASPDVTLEEDLQRRDLTINAMARDEDGNLIDPYGGRHDLDARIFRHVSPAFTEDPVRILRVARFAARFDGFALAPETLTLMRTMVDNGEVDHLVPERVWQELARGLMEATPSRMLVVLHDSGALARLLPEIDHLLDDARASDGRREHLLAVLDHAARRNAPLEVRWACLLHASGDRPESKAGSARAISERVKATNECRDLARLLAGELDTLHRADALPAAERVALLERADALRRPERFELLLQAAESECLGRPGGTRSAYPPGRLWRETLAAVKAVDAGAIALRSPDKASIPARIRSARIAAAAKASGTESTRDR